ncbi:dTDP-glucose 4,6-dehydratase [Neorhizobium sp. JUb45]|nr:dTDP-glucose 4,6-dehydratase [Neorhizobium sp. JUb45]
MTIVVLSRNPRKFADQCPHLANDPAVSFIQGDVRDFTGLTGTFSHILHAATDVIASNTALDTFDVTVAGTQRVLDVARDHGAKNVLLLSSGAVYGRLAEPVDRIPETQPCTSDVTASSAAYGLGKIATEWLGNAYGQQYGFACKSARIFAQVGPYLELDAHFAAGNFIRDALRGQTLTIKGDGTSLRSYMYATDLVAWLLAILVRGRAETSYNVGSEQAVSIRELAEAVARVTGLDSSNVKILGQPALGVAPDRYVPSTQFAQSDLGLSITVPFEEALLRTAEWYRPQFSTGKR